MPVAPCSFFNELLPTSLTSKRTSNIRENLYSMRISLGYTYRLLLAACCKSSTSNEENERAIYRASSGPAKASCSSRSTAFKVAKFPFFPLPHIKSIEYWGSLKWPTYFYLYAQSQRKNLFVGAKCG